MNKYKEYYYTTKKVSGGYSWTIRNVKGEILQESEELSQSKRMAEIDAEENIQEYYS